jgi:hypothetical protein
MKRNLSNVWWILFGFALQTAGVGGLLLASYGAYSIGMLVLLFIVSPICLLAGGIIMDLCAFDFFCPERRRIRFDDEIEPEWLNLFLVPGLSLAAILGLCFFKNRVSELSISVVEKIMESSLLLLGLGFQTYSFYLISQGQLQIRPIASTFIIGTVMLTGFFIEIIEEDVIVSVEKQHYFIGGMLSLVSWVGVAMYFLIIRGRLRYWIGGGPMTSFGADV